MSYESVSWLDVCSSCWWMYVKCMTYSHCPLWANKLSYFSHSPNQSLIFSFKVSLSLALSLYPSLSSVHPSLPAFPVTTKHLFKAFRALSEEPGWLSYLCCTTHQLYRDRVGATGEGREGHCLCPQQKQWKRVGLTLYMWWLMGINLSEDTVWRFWNT